MHLYFLAIFKPTFDFASTIFVIEKTMSPAPSIVRLILGPVGPFAERTSWCVLTITTVYSS